MFAERKAGWGWTTGGPEQLAQAFGIYFIVQCFPWLHTVHDSSQEEPPGEQHGRDLQSLGEGILQEKSSLPGPVTGWPRSALSKAVATSKATVPLPRTHGQQLATLLQLKAHFHIPLSYELSLVTPPLL